MLLVILFCLGDNPPHAMWNETFESQIENSRLVANMLRSRLGGLPVYPSIGNHGQV